MGDPASVNHHPCWGEAFLAGAPDFPMLLQEYTLHRLLEITPVDSLVHEAGLGRDAFFDVIVSVIWDE